MSDDITALQAEVAELRATVARLTAQVDGSVRPVQAAAPHSRRDLLKLAGGVAAGAAGALVVSASPAGAANADPLTVGTRATPTPGTTPTSGIN